MDVLGLRGTLLETDIVRDRELVGRDLNSDEIARLTGTILQSIWRQPRTGYVLGRGNQQIEPR